MQVLQVALDLPLDRVFDYSAPAADPAAMTVPVQRGHQVRVPFGRGEKIGVVVAVVATSAVTPGQLKAANAVLADRPLLPEDWIVFCEFAAAYYQSPLGEVMAQALPPGLRQLKEKKARAAKPAAVQKGCAAGTTCKKTAVAPPGPTATPDQQAAISAVAASFGSFQPFLLFGITGSGKTEVYLRLVELALARGGQVLLLVPEINLTPQLETRVAERFPEVATVSLHSELTATARTRNWAAAATGAARIVLGTRLAIFTPLPDLALLIVDEEHDASFKQQDGMRYSARDLAVFRARQRQVPIVLGSATPSLETWANAESGRYSRLVLGSRAVAQAKLPTVRLIDTRKEKLGEGLSAELARAIEARLCRNEQSLIFLNRRGYAPVLACTACGWVSRCKRCAANLVVHLADRRLRCHHCGFETPVPRACPDCGNQDIHPFGRGTQRLETHLIERFPGARVLRVDRDAARSRKQWEALAAQIHAGEADILVGTQMLAKGHDFPRLTLVGVVSTDAALFAADWRAPERLFAQLMQVAGRAGRAEWPGEVLIQTEKPEHPLYAALCNHDFPPFAASLLREREEAGFPPYTFQAMLRAEAPQMADSLAFLHTAREIGRSSAAEVMLYDPVPMRLARLANLERAQLLVESMSRPQLQRFLTDWRAALVGIKSPSRLRWHLEVDPLEC